ncbi:protein kinase [Nocardiopsis sp. HNM0947]|uniref:Protein kinase n=1 Tax=Nocardiopsis coralli TaxID=2772213 RepID=A0ABR9PAQ8_9ACTN|nr:WD40 repeat domain-containing serine/threonine protein kinase [Nocardiopsis coralli]MBE3000914.1 protein kinase [Nocardiopsis coralli]
MQPLTSTDPTEIGPHQVLGRLGAGGMGAVYLARTPDRRLAALKVIHRELAASSDFQARFGREVRTAQMVRGPYTPAVIAAEPYGPTPWMATEYVPGPTLKAAVTANGPFPETSLRVLALGLAQALQSVHAAGLMHRDLKPGNVLLSPRGPQVIDFGIARAVEGTVLTKTGQAFGTPAYASPETVLGREQTPASDLFSLAGVVLYAAQGHPPFGTKPAADVLTRVVSSEPDLSNLPPGSLRELITRCLAKDPADRPTADELVRVLSAEPLPPAEHGWLPANVHRSIDFHQHELHTVSSTVPTLGASLPQTTATGRRARTWLVAGAATMALGLVAGLGTVLHGPWGNAADDGTDAAEESTTEQENLPDSIEGTLYGLEFTEDGDSLFVQTAQGLTLWDWRESEATRNLGDASLNFTTTPSGEAVGVSGDLIVVLDQNQEQVADLLVDEPDNMDNFRFYEAVTATPDGTILAVQRTVEHDEYLLREWDWRSDETTDRELDAPVHALDHSPSGTHLAITHGAGEMDDPDAPAESEHTQTEGSADYVSVVDTDSEDTVLRFPEEGEESVGAGLYDVAFSPDGSLVAIAEGGERVLVYDLEEDEVLHELTPRGLVNGMTFDNDGTYLFTGAVTRATSPVGGSQWDLETGEEVESGNTLIYEQPTLHPERETLVVADSSVEETTLIFLDPDTLTDTHQFN